MQRHAGEPVNSCPTLAHRTDEASPGALWLVVARRLASIRCKTSHVVCGLGSRSGPLSSRSRDGHIVIPPGRDVGFETGDIEAAFIVQERSVTAGISEPRVADIGHRLDVPVVGLLPPAPRGPLPWRPALDAAFRVGVALSFARLVVTTKALSRSLRASRTPHRRARWRWCCQCCRRVRCPGADQGYEDPGGQRTASRLRLVIWVRRPTCGRLFRVPSGVLRSEGRVQLTVLGLPIERRLPGLPAGWCSQSVRRSMLMQVSVPSPALPLSVPRRRRGCRHRSRRRAGRRRRTPRSGRSRPRLAGSCPTRGCRQVVITRAAVENRVQPVVDRFEHVVPALAG